MERMPGEIFLKETSPVESAEQLGGEFNNMEFADFIDVLRKKKKENPEITFTILADFKNLEKVRAAKALWDRYHERLGIEKITIRATRAQYEQDINAFESGLIFKEQVNNQKTTD